MKSKEEIKQMAFLKYPRVIHDPYNPMEDDNSYERKIWIDGYNQCQEDMADKIKEAVNLLDKIVENNELFFGYDVANKNANIRNAKIFIKSLNKQD